MELLSSQTARLSPIPNSFASIRPPQRTIFLVQNGSSFGTTLKSALQERGYRVLYAESVEAGVRLWAELTQTVDLFLADMSLQKDPEVRRLVQVLQAENPRMRVLYANELDAIEGISSIQRYPHQLVRVVENCLS